MKIFRLILGIAAFNLVTSCLLQSECSAVQITAEAFGSSSPSVTADQSQTIQNGDFQIFRSSKLPDGNRGYLIGDGINEFTKWVFDFKADPNFLIFDADQPLTSADLLITLIPQGEDFSSDFVRIDSLPNFNIGSLVPVFAINDPITLKIDLLEFYNSSLIIDLLKTGLGVLGMRYEDDAIVVNASLSLSNSVPEPSTYLLLFIGIGIATAQKIRRSPQSFY